MLAESATSTVPQDKELLSWLLELIRTNPQESFFVLISIALVFMAFVVAWKYAPQKNGSTGIGPLFYVIAIALLGVGCVIYSTSRIGLKDGKLQIVSLNREPFGVEVKTAFERLEENTHAYRLIR